ncbi:hypothetical protein Vretimale_2412 [Volvox reticuliferus]|uniref:inosine/xanthosine triphosphatase n=1 Tax=Volvox reticuliferus TaxID=1737510 RepID=A0A8J4D9R6_9CHLO|nr:hypothetical protein Vretifemale_4626 [Volvox reticuliferus]GIL96648.1 hypothetical protein Vretimale_2412 [Volvox reticuliferus]
MLPDGIMAPISRSLQVRAQAAGPALGGSAHRNPQLPQNHATARVVLVASKNPVKVNAVQRALQRCFPSLELAITGREAASGVPDQPYGDEETLAGARNRVAVLSCAATATGLSIATATAAENSKIPPSAATAASLPRPEGLSPSADLLVAIEGGVGTAKAPGQAGALECFAWVCVRDPYTGAESTARTASFALPGALSDLMRDTGMELGDADDAVFGRVRSKQGSGTIGKLSNGVLDRTEYYVQATVCALLPYMQPQLYGTEYGRFLGSDEPCTGASQRPDDNNAVIK